MATTVGTETDLNSLLVDLIQLDYDAVEAYQAAIDRLDDPSIKENLMKFMADHVRHIEDLGQVLSDSGQQPPRKGDMKRFLIKGKVVLAGLAGDKAILMAMKTNRDDTNTAYERAVNNDVAPARVKEILRRNLADERRHREWIVKRIDTL
jgi:uncharacterized protein (TIGR02284 family)